MKTVIVKLKESITNNLVLKIAAIFIAALVWLAVVNLSDPTKTITIYGVPIELANEEAVTDQNKVYFVESKLTLNITVTGKRSVVSELSADDFEAIAPLDEISVVNSVQVEVSPKKKSIESRISIVNQSVKAVTVNVEDLVTQEYAIDIDMVGSLANGYYLGGYSSTRNSIVVTAPESVQQQIVKAAAVVDLSDAKQSFEDKYVIRLYNANNEVVKSANITKSYRKTRVSVDVLKGMSVPIKVQYSGEPEKGYRVTKMDCDTEKVTIIGKESAIANISEIEIPKEDVSIAQAKENVEVMISLNQYLPEGVRVIDSAKSVVKVTVNIEKLQTKELKINKKEIAIKNLENGYDAEIVDNAITVRLVGLASDLEEITTNDIKASIDLSGVKSSKSVKVSIFEPRHTRVEKEVKVKVKITKK